MAKINDERTAFRSLIRWYRPYLKGSGLIFVVGVMLTIIMLTCQAVIPLVLESLLHHGHWDYWVYILIGLIIAQLVVGYFAHIAGHSIAVHSANRLRNHIFSATLANRTMNGQELVRSSIVSHHTSDVDHLSKAFEETFTSGMPGVFRILLSLSLLTYIEWRAGIAMIIATCVFLIIRNAIGKNLIVLDRAKLDASSQVGESVDEALTSSRNIAGIQMFGWAATRFEARSLRLNDAAHHQGIAVARLFTAAHAAGLAGLLFVVLFALTSGQEMLAAVAAALLYVEGVVRGLEALPPWIRSIQLALVSRIRVDQVLLDSAQEEENLRAFVQDIDASLTLAALDFPSGALIGLVTDANLEPSTVLSILATGTEDNNWRETYDGYFIRKPGVNPDVYLVPEDATGFNASLREQFLAVREDLNDNTIASLLSDVGLGELATGDKALDLPLGPGAARLSPNERQRLMLALGLAAQPRVLLIGPLIAFSDSDTAMPLLNGVRKHHIPQVVITMKNPSWAHAVDSVLYCSKASHTTGTHEELLVSTPSYAEIWSSRLNTTDVDLSSIGIPAGQTETLMTRLLTERFETGDFIYRQGAAADRVVFIISGKVEIATNTATGDTRRVAVLGPGNHCGDLRLTVGEERNENAIAMETTVTRSLSREAISAGMMGLLDRTPAERRIVSSILREGSLTFEELSARLTEFDTSDLASAIDLLLSDRALRNNDGTYSVVQKRAVKAGSRAILDKLTFD